MVLVPVVGMIAGVKILEIICKSRNDDRANARGQRYLITFRRKTTLRMGRSLKVRSSTSSGQRGL